MYSAVVDERRMQEIEGPAMKGAVSYTSSVIMSMSAAATLAGVDCLQVPTSSTLIDSEDCYDVASSNATMPEVEAEIEIEAQQYFKDGVKRSGTDMALHLCGAECPRIVLSHFTDIEVPELGVKLPTCGLRVERLHKQLWCKSGNIYRWHGHGSPVPHLVSRFGQQYRLQDLSLPGARHH